MPKCLILRLVGSHYLNRKLYVKTNNSEAQLLPSTPKPSSSHTYETPKARKKTFRFRPLTPKTPQPHLQYENDDSDDAQNVD